MNYDTLLSERIKDVKPSGIRRFFDILEEMKDAISLGIGEPDFPTPWHIRDAGIYSLEKGFTKYTSNAGLAELRREIASYLARRFGYRACIFSVGILYAAEHLCYAFANSMGVLIGAQILHGAFSGLFMGISASYLYTLIPPSLSTTAHSLAIAGSNILSVLGNLGSGYLLEGAGVRTLYQCLTLPPALAVLIFALTLLLGRARHIAPYDSAQDALECALNRVSGGA